MFTFPLLTLLGCPPSDDQNPIASGDSDSAVDTDPCAAGPTVTISSPADGAVFSTGDAVSLEASGAGTVLTASWSVDSVVVASEPSASWTAEAGDHLVSVTWETECGSASDEVSVQVLDSLVSVYGDDAGLSGLSWRGLSAGSDGSVWAATDVGLFHVVAASDGESATVRTYTTADGLYTEGPYSVLAHSDGSVWVGDVGDLERQGSHFSVGSDGALTLLDSVAFTATAEVAYVLRMREQPFGEGAGDVWMGTNEGACVYDEDQAVFIEHAHPTHPHGLSYGIAFTPDANMWNGDQNQISRWLYDDDAYIFDDLLEYWVPWPVELEAVIDLTDIDADEYTLWVASSTYGIVRVDVGTEVATSVTTVMESPFPTSANAIRADGDGHVWIGSDTGLMVWDTATETMTDVTAFLPDTGVTQLTVDPSTTPPTVWAATSGGLVRFTGSP